jgi:hypothetical protein
MWCCLAYAGDAFKFAFIKRPHVDLTFEQVVEGLITLAKPPDSIVEVFCCATRPLNRRKEDRRLGQAHPADRVPQHRRASASPGLPGVSADALAHFARHFSPPAEVVTERVSRLSYKSAKLDSAAVLELLRRRPCTTEQLANGLGLNRPEVLKWLEAFAERGDIQTSRHEGQVYYRASARPSPYAPLTSSRCSRKQTINQRTS